MVGTSEGMPVGDAVGTAGIEVEDVSTYSYTRRTVVRRKTIERAYAYVVQVVGETTRLLPHRRKHSV